MLTKKGSGTGDALHEVGHWASLGIEKANLIRGRGTRRRIGNVKRISHSMWGADGGGTMEGCQGGNFGEKWSYLACSRGHPRDWK